MRNFSLVFERRKGQSSWGRVLAPNSRNRENMVKHKNLTFVPFIASATLKAVSLQLNGMLMMWKYSRQYNTYGKISSLLTEPAWSSHINTSLQRIQRQGVISEIGLAWSTGLEEALNVGSLLKERGIHSIQCACSFALLMLDLCLQNEVYTVCSTLVPSRGLCQIFAYRTRHTQCVARLFLCVAYVGSLLIERGIHSVQRACSFSWLMSDLCLQNEAYTVCSVLVPSRGLCWIFAYRTRHTLCVARLFVRVAYVGSLFKEQ